MILARSKSSIIRANLVIGVGDLVISFSSLFDGTITYLYQRLKDEDFHVRKNTMMILTFLILNGMIKVKGQISEMALCTEDNDPRIKAMARSFFKELSTKDNAIYNNLPDIISNLSTADETTYRKIVKYLFSFIAKVFDTNKEKQQESIVEKLCLRFLHASDQRQWRDIGYCLSLLSFGTEKSFKKLMDALPLYQDKLHEASLYKSLTDIFGRAGKGAGKSDLKNLVDDFKEVLAKARQNALDNSDAAKDAVAKADIKLKLPKISENDEESLENNDADANGPVQADQYSDADNNPEKVEKAFKSHVQDSDATDAEPEPESKIIEDLITPKPKRGNTLNRKKAVGRRRTTRKRTVIADSDDE